MNFSCIVNHSQTRLMADRLGSVAGGSELNGVIWENVWIDPMTHTLMLRPYALDPEWYLSSEGNYAKLHLSEFSFSGGWEERTDQHWAGPWLAVKDSATNPAAITVESFPKNMGLVFSWFSYGAGDTFLQYKVGWNSSPTDTDGVALHFWSDGRVDVLKNGTQISTGKISGARSREVRRLQVFEVLIIPMRHRELLIVSQSGDGFSVVFEDIDKSDVNPVITPPGKVWFKCESGATQAQIAPLRFYSNGFATSLKTCFLEPPTTGESLAEFENENWLESPAPYRIYGFPGFSEGEQSVFADLVEWDGSTPYIPDGENNEIRIKVNLSSSHELFSPFVMGVQLAYPAINALTSDEDEREITLSVTQAVLTVPDRVDGVELELELIEYDSETELLTSVLNKGSLPISIDIDGNGVLNGISEPVTQVNPSSHLTLGRMVVRDRWSLLDEAIFADRIPLDGLLFSEALRALVEKSGIPTDRINISETTLRIPYSTSEVSGEWRLLVDSGDRASDWVRRLMDTFAPTWWYGFRPAPDGSGEEFYALDESDLPTEPSTFLYSSVTEGMAYRSVKRSYIEPQANEVRVTGEDPRTLRPIQSVCKSGAQQSVETSPAMRSVGWSGTIRRFTFIDAALTDQQSIDHVCSSLFASMNAGSEVIQFETDFLFNDAGIALWRGDVVHLQGIGNVRIRSFGLQISHEDENFTFRKAIYCGEILV